MKSFIEARSDYLKKGAHLDSVKIEYSLLFFIVKEPL